MRRVHTRSRARRDRRWRHRSRPARTRSRNGTRQPDVPGRPRPARSRPSSCRSPARRVPSASDSAKPRDPHPSLHRVGAHDAELGVERLTPLDGVTSRAGHRRGEVVGMDHRAEQLDGRRHVGRQRRGSGGTPRTTTADRVRRSNSKLPRWAMPWASASIRRLSSRARCSARRSVMSWAMIESPTTSPTSSVDRGCHHIHLHQTAVLAPPDRLEVLVRTVGAEAGPDLAPARRHRSIGAINGDRPADDLLGRVPEQPRGGPVPAGDHPVDGGPEDGVAGAVDEGGELATASRRSACAR